MTFDDLFPGPSSSSSSSSKQQEEEEKNGDAAFDPFAGKPREEYLPNSPNPRPWPSIESVSSEKKLPQLMDAPADVSEKLDGSNISLSSRGLICSRRLVLFNRPGSRSELASRRFSGITLEGLWSPLMAMPGVESALRMKVFPDRDLVVTVYGELVQEGTATGKKDKFGYGARGFKVGHIYAFGLAVHLQQGDEDKDEVERAKETLEKEGFCVSVTKVEGRHAVYLHLDTALEAMLRQCGISAVRSKRVERLADVFAMYAGHLGKEEATVEGVVINLRGKGKALKWKGLEESYNQERVQQLKQTLQTLTAVHPSAALAIASVAEASPRFRAERDLGGLLLDAYLSARSKFPTVADEAANTPGREEEALVAAYASKVAREMVEADSGGNQAFVKKAKPFVLARAKEELREGR